MKNYLHMMMSIIFICCMVTPATSHAAIADGTHSLTYQVNKPGSSSASMANDYFLKPAKLIVKNGKMTVQLTIKNSTWVTEFKPPGGATVISTNASADQRVVQFNISSVDNITVGMKIDIDEIDYHHSYSVDFVLDGSGLPEVQKEVSAPATTTEPTSKEQTNSSSGSTTSLNKPAETNSQSQTNSTSTEQPKPTSTEDSTSESIENAESTELPVAEHTEEVENPETSDALPLFYVVVFMAAAIVFIRTKQIKAN